MNVRTLCLGILNFEDATGYEIRKMSMEGKYSYFIDASYGSIYPALNKLESEGLISCREETQPGKPARKIYSINKAGREELVKALSETPAPDVFRSEFLMIAISAAHLPRDVVVRAIDAHVEHLNREISQLSQIVDTDKAENINWAANYGLHCMRQSLSYVEMTRTRLENAAGTGMDVAKTEPVHHDHNADMPPKAALAAGGR